LCLFLLLGDKLASALLARPLLVFVIARINNNAIRPAVRKFSLNIPLLRRQVVNLSARTTSFSGQWEFFKLIDHPYEWGMR